MSENEYKEYMTIVTEGESPVSKYKDTIQWDTDNYTDKDSYVIEYNAYLRDWN